MADYLLPDVGEGLTEAEIVSWRVKEGDTIEINDIVVEIETAKSLVELPSPYAGTVTGLLVSEGETVAVGTPIISIGVAGEAPAPAAEPPAARDIGEIDLSNPAASGGGEGESLVGRNKADRGPLRRARKGSASPSTEAGAASQLQLQGAFAPGGAQSDAVAEADEPAVPARAPRAPRGQCDPCPREAAGAQAGQGPRRRPRPGDRHRSAGLDHPRRPVGGGRRSTRTSYEAAAAGSTSSYRRWRTASAASRSRASGR